MLEKQAVMVILWYNETTSYPNTNMDGGMPGTPAAVTYMLKKQAVMDIPVRHLLKPAVQLEHQQFVTYLLVKHAAQIHISYGYCIHTTTEVLYIVKTACTPGNYEYICRYDYKGWRHYQIAFGAMPTISRS